MTETIRPCILVPTRNHVRALPQLLDAAANLALPVLIVDDGSDAAPAATIVELSGARDNVSLLRLEANQGKGAAVVAGLRALAARGYSHAFQLDADGQQDLAAIPGFLAAAAEHPDALVAGQAVFDQSVPTGRRVGRWITHFWVMIHMLLLRVVDSMCGFRVYPLAPTMALVDQVRLGQRMDFDTDVLVRLYWAGTPVALLPVHVVYPEGNVSNFRMVADNVAITAMHTRLFFGMLRRLPRLLWHRPPLIDSVALASEQIGGRHWADIGERGAYWGLLVLMGAYRALGRRACWWLMTPVVLFFFLTGAEQRRSSAQYLRRLHSQGHLRRPPGITDQLRHFMSFGTSALDTVAAWSGELAIGDVEGAETGPFAVADAAPEGAFVLTAHLGNAQVVRAIGDRNRLRRVTVLVHTRNADRFNRLIARLAPEASFRVVEVTDLGIDKVMLLKDAIEAGEWVVSVADRVSVQARSRVVWTPFLGEPAPFPQGPFILASLLEAPVYTLFCLKEGAGYRLHFEKLADRLQLPREDRDARLRAAVAAYATHLEASLLAAPLQWFNFFDFWRPHGLVAPDPHPAGSERAPTMPPPA